jgi:hypothetical protein
MAEPPTETAAAPGKPGFDIGTHIIEIRDFFNAHTAFELVPDSGKVVVMEVGLTIGQAFHLLQQNGLKRFCDSPSSGNTGWF